MNNEKFMSNSRLFLSEMLKGKIVNIGKDSFVFHQRTNGIHHLNSNTILGVSEFCDKYGNSDEYSFEDDVVLA